MREYKFNSLDELKKFVRQHEINYNHKLSVYCNYRILTAVI